MEPQKATGLVPWAGAEKTGRYVGGLWVPSNGANL